MAFNLNQIASVVKIAKTIRNPAQAKQMLLGKISQKNPQLAKSLEVAMQSGRNPAEYLRESVANGTVSAENLNEVKRGYQMAQKFGLTQKVPENVWQELEQAVQTQPQKFSGF